MKHAAFLIVLALGMPAMAQQPPAPNGIDRAMEIVGSDPAGARRIVEPLAQAGDAEALNMLAMLAANDGPGWKADPAKAKALREQAIAAGSRAAALNLATQELVEASGDHKRAIELLRLAETDPLIGPMTAYPWARAYLFGRGVARDLKTGTEYLQKAVAADPKNVDAQFLLGRAYQNGWGVTPNPALAYTHMRIASDRGDPRAQWYSAMMLLEGSGVPASKTEAYALVTKSAEGGFIDGMISRAVMLATGDGVTENDAEARRWYLEASELGSAHALRGLGLMLIVGEGGAAEIDRGFALLELAVEAGEPGAIQLMPRLLQQGTPNRAAVDKAKAKWVSAHGAPNPAGS